MNTNFRCPKCQFPVCGEDLCRYFVNLDASLFKQKSPHTKEECQFLQDTKLGCSFSELRGEHIIYECIFILRM